MATAVEPQNEHGHGGHDDWHHKPFSAHHFENAEQQFDSGKLGMWLFLVTEVLFFSGLFVAYAVYRAHHPEVFQYASQYLDKYLGGLNTIVLIFSSLTMAWGVRCAQLGQRNGLILMLAITLACAALFLGVKTFEYTEKAHKRLLWAGAFVNATDINKSLGGPEANPNTHIFVVEKEGPPPELFEERMMVSLRRIERFWGFTLLLPLALIGIGYGVNKRPVRTVGYGVLISVVAILLGIESSIQIHEYQHSGDHVAHAEDHHPEKHPEHTGVAGSVVDPMLGAETATADPAMMPAKPETPRHASVFFSIYYFMTGLHAFHIICGMIAITWLLVRAVEGHFRPDYFGPVDFVGLYWHIVDLIWIYLFPLLYLINA